MEIALKESKGMAVVALAGDGGKTGEETVFSEHYACAGCGISIPEIEPRLFSFNTPFGACQECGGLGNKIEIDENLIVPDKTRSLRQGTSKSMEPSMTV